MEHGVANSKRKNRPSDAHTKRQERRRGLEQEDVTHKLQVVVHGVRIDQDAHDMGHLRNEVGRPEDGRDIGPRRDDNAPQMHNVAEKDGERREHHAQAHAEAHKQEQANRQQDQVPRRHNTEPQHNDGDGDQREGKVDQREEHLLYREDPAVNLDLLEQRSCAHDRRQRLVRGLGHHGKGNVTHDQVQRVHLGRNGAVATLGKNRRKHDGHDDHHQQRVEYRPCNA